jgi:hypothetical protein
VRPESVVNALSKMIEAAAQRGLILDLQVIRPDPFVELEGELVARIDGEPLFEWADAATSAVDARIAAGDLVEEAVNDHDVRKHYSDGADLVEDFARSKAVSSGAGGAEAPGDRQAAPPAGALSGTPVARVLT